MKLANSTIVAIVVAGGFSLTAYVMGQGQGAAGAAPSTGMNPAGPAVNGQSLQGQPAPQTTIGPTTQTTPGPITQTTVGPISQTTPGPITQTTVGPTSQTTPGPITQTTVGPVTQTTPGPITQTTVGPVTGTSRSATSAKTKTKQ